MGAGGLLLYLRQPGFDFTQDPINIFFEKNSHYILADSDDFVEVAKCFLGDKEKRKTIAFQASCLVKSEHTWSKRAEKILDDIRLLM